jgi:hypothetical protein
VRERSILDPGATVLAKNFLAQLDVLLFVLLGTVLVDVTLRPPRNDLVLTTAAFDPRILICQARRIGERDRIALRI